MQLNPAISASVAAAAASVVGLLPSQELQGIDASGIPFNPLHRALHKYGLDPSGVPLKMTNPNEISEAFKAQEQEKLRAQVQAQLAQVQAQMAKAQADAKAQVQAQAKEAERLRLKEISDPAGFAEEKRRALEMEEILAKVVADKAATPVYVEAVDQPVVQPSIFRPPVVQPAIESSLRPPCSRK